MGKQTVYYQVLVPAVTPASEAHVYYLGKISGLLTSLGVLGSDSEFSEDGLIPAQDDSPACWEGFFEITFPEENDEAIKTVENALINEGVIVSVVESDD